MAEAVAGAKIRRKRGTGTLFLRHGSWYAAYWDGEARRKVKLGRCTRETANGMLSDLLSGKEVQPVDNYGPAHLMALPDDELEQLIDDALAESFRRIHEVRTAKMSAPVESQEVAAPTVPDPHIAVLREMAEHGTRMGWIGQTAERLCRSSRSIKNSLIALKARGLVTGRDGAADITRAGRKALRERCLESGRDKE